MLVALLYRGLGVALCSRLLVVGSGCGVFGCLCCLCYPPFLQQHAAYRENVKKQVGGGDVCALVDVGGDIFVVQFMFCVISFLLYFSVCE